MTGFTEQLPYDDSVIIVCPRLLFIPDIDSNFVGMVCLYSSKHDWLSAEEENPYSVICKKTIRTLMEYGG